MSDARLCIVGAGGHATRNLYPAIQEAGGKIVAIATRHVESAQKAAKKMGKPLKRP